jgi:hypothetical protein
MAQTSTTDRDPMRNLTEKGTALRVGCDCRFIEQSSMVWFDSGKLPPFAFALLYLKFHNSLDRQKQQVFRLEGVPLS